MRVNKRMRFFLVTIGMFLLIEGYGQSADSVEIKYKIRNVIWTTPVSKNTKINGLAIGLMAVPWIKAESLKITGLNIDASPFAVFGGVFAIAGTIFSPFNTTKERQDEPKDLGSRDVFPDSLTGLPDTDIKGLSLSAELFKNYELRGVGINGFISFTEQTNGLEITGIMNLHYSFKGVIVAGLRNKTTTGKGLQIGLINSCKKGRVVQIGLINRIGKRIVPIINFSLKKPKNSIQSRV
jgi:hypothetical protein